MRNWLRVSLLPLLWLTALLACGPVIRLTPTPVTEVVPTRDLAATAVTPLQLTVTALANQVATSVAAATHGAATPVPPTEGTVTPPAPATRAATSPTTLKLTDQGPWLLFSAADGVWAANADGSGLTHLAPTQPFLVLGPAAPSGGHAVVLTASDSAGLHNLTLSLLTLPGGDLKKIAALTSASTEPPATAQRGVGAFYDMLRSLGQAAWSPDGLHLAFIGAQAGPSADLFRYDVATGQVTRLTDDPSQTYAPSWSPDGRFVVMMGASTFGTGAGYSMDGVWAVAADGASLKLLYKPDSGGETLLGWTGPETFAVSSFYARCSNGKLRTVDIPSGQVQPIFGGYDTQLAVDPATGTALVAVNKSVAACTAGQQPGLFLARPGAAPQLVDAQLGNAGSLFWSGRAGMFFASTDAGWLGFQPDGQPAKLPDVLTGQPVIAPGGHNWAWIDQTRGVVEVSANGAPAQTVFSGDAVHPTWSPDGRTLLFFANDQLYASGPDEFTHPRLAQPAATVLVSEIDHAEWSHSADTGVGEALNQ